ncbi:Eco57I restriction-modification methylase domain-containing protein, partial [Thiospirillum jenense]
ADQEIRVDWLDYASHFPHQSAWFRAAPQFSFQSAIVNGKKTGSDINLYKLFTEQCVNLLRAGGECGIVIPSGIYTDLGAKGLRDLLFDQCDVTGLFCFENRNEIFENVHRSFKFVVLTFEKGQSTRQFPAAFMRHQVNELAAFPSSTDLLLSVELIRRLSPDSQSVMEFKSALDVQIAEKLLQFPLLGETIDGKWNVRLSQEFHMTNDSHLFKTAAGAGRLPLFE